MEDRFTLLRYRGIDQGVTVMKEEKEKKQKKKLEGIEVKPGMSKEQIYKNLVKMLKKQGITITKE